MSQFKEIPSIAIAIVKDDNVIFKKVYGYSDVRNGIMSTTSTSYYIASTTKSFVGLLIAQLADEMLFDLNDEITKFSPIKNFKNQAIFKGVTIKDLISHTSGIGNDYLTWRYSSEGEYTTKDLINALEHKTYSLNNYKNFRYNNFGYNVIDLILSEEFNLNWKKLLDKKVFKPLNMKHTSAYLSDAENNNWNYALPYVSVNANREPHLTTTQKNDATFHAAGGIISSIDDMANWLLMNMNQGKFKGRKVFNENVITKAHAKATEGNGNFGMFNANGYSLGWTNGSFGKHEAVFHYGGFDGAASMISWLLKDNLGLVIIVNESHFGKGFSDLVGSFAYDILLGNVKSIEDYNTKTNAFKEKVESKQGFDKWDENNRAKLSWNLKYNFKNYIGTYVHPYAGKLHIKLNEKGDIIANIGISTAKASPSQNDDAMRVEFRDGRGHNIQFVRGKRGEMVAAIFGGDVYYFVE
ncbi:serine hydrolase domain-containing protein [uncultured Lutibacter sp.]|uniref:serine hydrolase domain-containing protein n=1 Tax=uncultured Lutibacter sp. TaxID=437739 RepID=UPI00260EA8CD|nr:serine hydrolase domain-containing protein [uncultured Lutibacter sp.]